MPETYRIQPTEEESRELAMYQAGVISYEWLWRRCPRLFPFGPYPIIEFKPVRTGQAGSRIETERNKNHE